MTTQTSHALLRLPRAIRGCIPHGGWAVLLVLHMALSRGAAAAPGDPRLKAPIFVLEAHTGERPREIAPLVETLHDELEKRGFAARPATILQAAPGLPRPGILDRGMTAAAISLQVEKGYDLFTKAKYREAIAVLAPTTEAFQRNPALIVLNASNVDLMQKAYMSLALSQSYINDSAASGTMMEEIRIFPTRPFPKNDYGPNDEAQYRKIYKQAQSSGRGRLFVTTGDKQAVIFVEYQIRGVDKIVLPDLYSGTYHVFVQVPGSPGHQYDVEIRADEDTYLNVEPETDCSLSATDTWIGFQCASNEGRAQEVKYVGQIASRWSGRDLFGVIGTRRRAGRLVLTGTIYTTDGTMLRMISLDVSSATSTDVRQLARIMAEGGVSTDGITVVQGGITSSVADDAKPRWLTRPPVYFTFGALVALSSTSLYAFAPGDDGSKRFYTDYKTPALGGLIASSAVFGTGVYLWLREDNSTSVFAAAVIGGGVAATLSGVVLYVTDEDQRPRFRNSASPGIALSAVGVAASSLGVILRWKAQRSAVVPTAMVGAHSGVVALRGAF